MFKKLFKKPNPSSCPYRGVPSSKQCSLGMEEAKREWIKNKKVSSAALILNDIKDLKRDKYGFCMLVKGFEKRLYLIKNNKIKLEFLVALGQKGLGKKKEGDEKTPIGDYHIKWMISRSGPLKNNPGGKGSYLINGKTFSVLDTELYFGSIEDVRVKELPDGRKVVSKDPSNRPLNAEEILIAEDMKMYTYGKKNIFVMALDYPNQEDRKSGKTGSSIEIHGSDRLERMGFQRYKGTGGCIALLPSHAEQIYKYVNPGTPVRIKR